MSDPLDMSEALLERNVREHVAAATAALIGRAA